MPDIKFIALVFGIILLIVVGVRQGFKKVKKQQEISQKPVKAAKQLQKPKMTEEQFDRSWKNFSYLLLLAAAGSLYMVYMAVRAALSAVPGIAWVYWFDAGFSFAAAIACVFIWRLRTKSTVLLYFAFSIVPILLFMSLKGFKINALIHLFPMVLLYLVLKPIWENMKN